MVSGVLMPACEVSSVGLNASWLSFTDPQSVSIRVGKLHFTRPRLIFDLSIEFSGNGIDVVNVEVNQGSGTGVAYMLGQVEGNVTSSEEQIERHSGSKPMFIFDLEPEPSIPFRGFLTVFDVEDWN